MRMRVSPKSGSSVARAVAAVLLASAAAGCSSDASRFSGIFSDDNLTTASIGRSSVNGQPPVPSADVAGSSMPVSQQPDYASRQQAVSQPYPSQPGYDPMSTSSSSPARAAVQRSELASPAASAQAPASAARQEALAQPFPTAPAATARKTQPIVPAADPITTGSNPPAAPQDVAARAASEPAALPTGAPRPMPRPSDEQKVAVLPSGPSSRDKQQARAADPAKLVSGNSKPEGVTYTVKPGDSLARIAKETGTPIDALKSANGLTTATIRVGQTLKLPAGAGVKADEVKTASIPAKADKATPAAYQPPKETVTEAASADSKESAPAATGIGKYRWPVTGAVVSRYGQNTEGKRNDGIDISVPAGTSVKAAENGVVIYAGNGLKELGNTVLVRHDDGTVTVYGHADNLAVQRGQKVQRGQQLATSGMSGSATRPMLHFEVRKDATPVDPMTFLE
ncbi:peptidoglycan DD-metalloendopeptidase family protein [Pseudomonas sp. R2.Fl]|nr:peptidoglycan DD-metalloendopeptidase family protein [Pseudomonas sp. R2.Fl]